MSHEEEEMMKRQKQKQGRWRNLMTISTVVFIAHIHAIIIIITLASPFGVDVVVIVVDSGGQKRRSNPNEFRIEE